MFSNQALKFRLFDKISLVPLAVVEVCLKLENYLVLARNNKTEKLKTPRYQKFYKLIDSLQSLYSIT